MGNKQNKMKKKSRSMPNLAQQSKFSHMKGSLQKLNFLAGGTAKLSVAPQPLPLSAPPWGLLKEESLDRWKRACFFYGFGPLRQCHKKTDKYVQEDSWNSSHSIQAEHSKLDSSFLVKRHDDEETIRYGQESQLKDAFMAAEFQSAIPASRDYVAFLFSLEFEQTYLLCLASQKEKMWINFIIERYSAFHLHQCAISPDGTRICLLLSNRNPRVSVYYPQDRVKVTNETRFDIQVYSRRPAAFNRDFQGNMFELEYEVPGVFACQGTPKVMFDPRFYSSRLAIMNVKSIQNQEIMYYFTVYDLQRKRFFITHKDTCPQRVQDCILQGAVFSPDGSLVLALVLSSDDSALQQVSRGLLIFETDSLFLVKVIEIETNSIDECYLNFMPMFSVSGQHMLLRHRKAIAVYQIPSPKTLQGLCRATLLHTFNTEELKRLQVPKKTKDFLLFRPTREV